VGIGQVTRIGPKTASCIAVALWLAALQAQAQPAPAGAIKGGAWVHTADSLVGLVDRAQVFLPPAATGGAAYAGLLKDAPATSGRRVPVVLFLHGSSGLGLAAIGEYQRWLGSLGYASVAPDSFALPDHVTYTSPIDKASYERIHALRASEIAPTLQAILSRPWAEPTRIVLAGTSEGAVPVARHDGAGFAARMIYAWSCEPNYFVAAPRTAVGDRKPVLNVISSTDPFFSRSNAWLGLADAAGHCGAAFKGQPDVAVVLVPDAPHTLLNLPAARHAAAGFLQAAVRP
jgi:hypothetical protein